MRILVISHEYPPIGGGGANACMKLTGEYIRQGHEVVIVTSWYEGLLQKEESERICIIRVPSKRSRKEHCSFSEMLHYLLKAWKVCDKLVKQQHFDICQVFFAIPSGPIGYYLKKRYKLPYIIRFGGGDIPGFQERFQRIYKLIGPFEKVIWKNAAALVANSAGLKRMAEGFYNKKEILVIPNGADVDVQLPKNREERNNYRILFVSRLIERKGLQFVIPQLSEIQKKCDRPVELIVVGDGPYREKLEKIATDCDVISMINFVGQKDKSELPMYYGNADVFILPSKKEGMPNVVLEAMSYGLPVIMTPCEGSEELIDGNGYVVRRESFGDNLAKLFDDDEKRSKFAVRSKELIKETFNWKVSGDKYIKLISEVIGKTRLV